MDKTFIRRVVNAMDRQTDKQQHGRSSDDSSASTSLVVFGNVSGHRLQKGDGFVAGDCGQAVPNSWVEGREFLERKRCDSEEWGRKGVSRERHPHLFSPQRSLIWRPEI